ncbi:MAG: ribonuclease III [Desulfobacteraceae bacterium]|nr:MAG: ribonuclease III [Desulfobacteraceae bacterium]
MKKMEAPLLETSLAQLSRNLGYSFNRQELLEESLRHSSYVNERDDKSLKDNERLEFLGDAVLDLAISHILMDFFRQAHEGDLSKLRAAVVNEKNLCQAAENLGLAQYLLLGKGEELTRGREKPSILANAMEALLGAIYLDSSFEKTKEIIFRLFGPDLARLGEKSLTDDHKTLLQEYTQEKFKSRPDYLLIEESGPAHHKTFRVALRLENRIIAEGIGASKKAAEQNAAKEAFFCLTKDPAML